MTPAELDECMSTVLAAWPHSHQTPETFDLAERLLAPLTFEAVMAAIAYFSLDGREHAPPVGMLARRAVELVEEASGNRLPDAEEALREVYTSISRVGIYRTPEWSHEAIANTVDALGGWEAVCSDENPEAFRAHFMKLYGTVHGRVRRQALMAPIMQGLAQALNFRADRELTP